MKRKNRSMLEGPLFTGIVSYTVPIILTSILQLLFNAADLVVVGQFCGSVSVGAVGATGAVTNLIVNLFIGCHCPWSRRTAGRGCPPNGAYIDSCGFDWRYNSDYRRCSFFRSIPAHDGNSGKCSGAFRGIYEDILCRYHFYDGL